MSIYQVIQGGVLVGPVELPPVPGAGQLLPDGFIKLQTELAKPNAGRAWAWDGTKAVQLLDQLGIYYRITDGTAVSHQTLGPLPEDLTSQPRPSPEHVWTGASWEVSLTLQAANRQAMASSLCAQVDAAADAARAAVAGDPLRAVEYDRARIEAEQFAAAGYLGEVSECVRSRVWAHDDGGSASAS